MRLVACLQPRLACFHRATVRALSSGSSSDSHRAPAVPSATGLSPAATSDGSKSNGVEAGDPHRQRPRAIVKMPAIKDTIELTDEEAALFKQLLDATKQVSSATGRCLTSTSLPAQHLHGIYLAGLRMCNQLCSVDGHDLSFSTIFYSLTWVM